jgi:hypothetical protein
VGVRGMRWRCAASMALAVALSVTAGCGTDETTTRPSAGQSTNGASVGATVSGAGLEWTQVTLDMLLIGGYTTVPVGDGFIGVRVDSTKTLAVDPGGNKISGMTVVTSPDGMSWADAAGTGLADDEAVRWLGGGPWGAVGYVATMEDEERAPTEVIFTADGSEFVRGSVPVEALGLGADAGVWAAAVAEPGVVAIVMSPQSQGIEGTAAVFSADLQTWQPVGFEDGDSPLVLGTAGFGVAGSPLGFWVTATRPAESQPPVFGYFSPDGRDWLQVSVPEQYGDVAAVSGWRDGFVMVTTKAGGAPAGLLSSDDGLSWSEMGGDPLSGLWSVASLSGSSLGVLVLSASGGPAVLVFSSDGQTWQRSTSQELFGVSGGGSLFESMGENSVLVETHPEAEDDEEDPDYTQVWVGVPAAG